MSRRLHLSVPLRWSDADAYGHINNVAVLALVEQARVLFFAQAECDGETLPRLDGENLGRSPIFLTGQRVEYLMPLRLEIEPVSIDMWVSHIGGADCELSYEIRQQPSSPVAATGLNGLVFMNPETGRPRRLSAGQRQVLDSLFGEQVRLRH
ncbi:acyl-CoA thioesterase [Pseudoclavibacter sp. 13-3]|uniref:acyl-CoA thioesterase n=1 Tax=Pseudoclavibacter sp. 13-3 TaxID=2901228 RepID=UPI001E2CCAEF|nr:thioesterase family protein [Pseudoclavibacter sp. 13-3]MCD7100521.1 thioesterase family protein [Pseudoclavibacter sp. 13-3]